MRRVELDDALALCLLHRSLDPARYDGMAVRWVARFCREVRGVTLADAHLLLAAMQALAPESPAASTLADLCERYGLTRTAHVAAERRPTR